MSAPAWVVEAMNAEKERRERFTPHLERLHGQFQRGLITVDEFADEVAKARFAAWQ